MRGATCLLAAVAAALLLSGCFGGTSIVVSDPPFEGQTVPSGGRVVANLKAENRGLYLFNWIPLISGSPNHPNLRAYTPFRNYLKEGYNLQMLEQMRKEVKAERLEQLETTVDSHGAFTLWLVWRRVMRTEAVAVSTQPQPKPKKAMDALEAGKTAEAKEAKDAK